MTCTPADLPARPGWWPRRARRWCGVAVDDDDHASAGQHPGEGHRAGQRSAARTAPESRAGRHRGGRRPRGRPAGRTRARPPVRAAAARRRRGRGRRRRAEAGHRPRRAGAAEGDQQGAQPAQDAHVPRIRRAGDSEGSSAWVCGGGCPPTWPVDGVWAPRRSHSRGAAPRSRTLTQRLLGADFARPQTTTALMFPWGSVSTVGEAPRSRTETWPGRMLAQTSGRPAPAGRKELKTTGESSRPALPEGTGRRECLPTQENLSWQSSPCASSSRAASTSVTRPVAGTRR